MVRLLFFGILLCACEAVELHPCVKADCGLFPEAGLPDAHLDGAGVMTGGRRADDGSDAGIVQGRLNILSRETARPIIGADVSINDTQLSTDTLGQVSLDVPTGPFNVTVSSSGYAKHRLVGFAAGTGFEQLLYLWSTQVWELLLLPNQLILDNRMGHVVIGLLDRRGQPALGARATISAPSDGPLVVQGQTARLAATIGERDEAWLLYPNTLPSTLEIETTARTGEECLAFPGRLPIEQIELNGGEVLTAIFLCE